MSLNNTWFTKRNGLWRIASVVVLLCMVMGAFLPFASLRTSAETLQDAGALEEGAVKNGLFRDTDGEIRYYENGIATYAGLVKDEKGNIYFINQTLKAVKGYYVVPEGKNNGIMPVGFYAFDEDRHMEIRNGIYTNDWLSHTYFFVNSVPQAVGVVQDADGKYYCFTTIYGTNRAVESCDFYVTEDLTNGLITAGLYRFNETGVLVGKGTVAIPEPKSDGLSFDEDGKIRYYKDGVPIQAGIVQVEDGSIYYFNQTLQAVKGYYAVPEEMTNGILPPGFYAFGEDYKLEIRNGIYTNDWLGHTYYFVNSVPQAVGVVQDADGKYYCFTTVYGTNRAVEDCEFYVTEEMTNGLIPAGTYLFDKTGMMIGAVETDESESASSGAEETVTVTEPITNREEETPAPEIPTGSVTEPVTDPVTGQTTETTENTGKPDETKKEELPQPGEADTTSDGGQSGKKGCKSSAGLGVLALLVPVACFVSRKKESSHQHP